MHIHGCKQTPPTPPTTTDEDSSGSSDDAETKKKKGNRAMGKKKYPKAIKYYSKAVKIEPENPTYRLNRAIANSALELWKDAEADAASAVELGDPPTSKSHYQLARARLRRGRCEEARTALKEGLEAFPNEAALERLSREIERACATIEARRRREEEAEAEQPAPAAGPSGSRALLDQARSLYAAGRIEEALALLRDARVAAAANASEESRRDEISILSLIGKASMHLKRWQDAAEAFQAVVELEQAAYSMDRREEREALSNAYNNLGICRKNAGDMRGAVEALNSAYIQATNGDEQVASPQAAQILQNSAQCLRAQKKPEEARKYYGRALEMAMRLYGEEHASHALNHMCIAKCFRDEGHAKEAIQSYTKAVEIWRGKDPDTCIAETPEVPTKERLAQLQQQCCSELRQLLDLVDQARTEATGAGATAVALDPAVSA